MKRCGSPDRRRALPLIIDGQNVLIMHPARLDNDSATRTQGAPSTVISRWTTNSPLAMLPNRCQGCVQCNCRAPTVAATVQAGSRESVSYVNIRERETRQRQTERLASFAHAVAHAMGSPTRFPRAH